MQLMYFTYNIIVIEYLIIYIILIVNWEMVSLHLLCPMVLYRLAPTR